MTAIIGVLTLAVVATMVFQTVRHNSQGPAETNAIFGGLANIYGTLMK